MHEKVPLGYGLDTTRLTNPAMEINQLPPLDLVLLSHFHGDHFDQVAIRELDKSLPIVSNSHAVDELSIRGFTNTKKLDTWKILHLLKKITIIMMLNFKLQQCLADMDHFQLQCFCLKLWVVF